MQPRKKEAEIKSPWLTFLNRTELVSNCSPKNSKYHNVQICARSECKVQKGSRESIEIVGEMGFENFFFNPGHRAIARVAVRCANSPTCLHLFLGLYVLNSL